VVGVSYTSAFPNVYNDKFAVLGAGDKVFVIGAEGDVAYALIVVVACEVSLVLADLVLYSPGVRVIYADESVFACCGEHRAVVAELKVPYLVSVISKFGQGM